MKQSFITYRNAEISYTIYGEGKAVVLIHGFAEDSNIWERPVSYLQEKCRLIVPDLPGSGQSTLINERGVSLEVYADCIKEILKAESIDKCTMIGHSMGGYITLAFAEKYPDTLEAFGLFHSSAYADDAAKIETRKKAIQFIQSNGAEAFLKTMIPGLFYDQGNSSNIDALIEKGKLFSKEALIQYYEAMIARPDRTQVLRDAKIPVLFIMGQHDKAVPFEHSLEQSHLPEHAYIQILRNSGHMGMLEETDEVNKTLANFLHERES
jgi:pimeloyl-ACP methyl ester carboxylesterase